MYNLWELLLAPGSWCFLLLHLQSKPDDWHDEISELESKHFSWGAWCMQLPFYYNSTLAFMAAFQTRLLRWLSHMSEAKGREVAADLLRGDRPEYNWYTVGQGLRQDTFEHRYSTSPLPGNGLFEPWLGHRTRNASVKFSEMCISLSSLYNVGCVLFQ